MAVIYRSIITSKFRTENLLNFYNSVGDLPTEHTIYATFGRSDSWAANESNPNFAPPYPDDTPAGISDMWSRMLGAVKIPVAYLRPVVPRYDWGDVRYENPYTFHINDIIVTNSAPYNQTEIGTGWMIFRCVDVPDAGQCSIESIMKKEECLSVGAIWTPSSQSTFPPKGRALAVDMNDGYLWEYLYTIPPDIAINECTTDHIVAPSQNEIIANPDRWGYEYVLEWYPKQYDLLHRMRCNTLRFRAYLDSIYFPEASRIGNTGFRQISIILDPLERKLLPTDVDVKAVNPFYLPSELEPHSGEMIYMENRQPIIRSRDQTEEFNLIFEF